MNTKERILTSAKELFSTRGYHKTTVDEIAKHVGLSKGALYFYFKSKEDVMKDLIQGMAERTLSIMQRWSEKEVNAEEAIKGHIREFLRECYQDRYIAYIFLFELLCLEEFRKIYFENMQKIKNLLSQMVKRGYERGEFAFGSVESVVNLIMGYTKVVYIELLLLGDLPLEEVIRRVEEGLETIFRGVRCAG
ncbi:MAG: TetR/AcrR family transcriptional regulator [Acidobacteria bacterium]|jgi:AcrR family transcriptional regulator|nr:MAG: TetR/AcrR family transcriptional regulator [Acidobacteriota bacterium]